jgi:3-oxoacyl-(acyl-carrier-protein) synthase
MSNELRVVVSGLGVVTSLAENVGDYYQALIEGRSGITRWREVDARISSKIGGDMHGFDLPRHLQHVGARYPADSVERALKLLRSTPASGRLTAAAALQAYAQAGLFGGALDPTRVAHVLGGHNLHPRYSFENSQTFVDEPDFIDPLYGLLGLDTDVLAVCSELLGIEGPTYTVGAACASSNMAMLSALDLLRAGRADAVLVTGAAMDVDSLWLQAWVIMDAISYRSFNDAPHAASRPFDRRREGFVPSVGAAAVLLETEASAARRKVEPLARVLGAGAASAATRLPKPNLDAQRRAIGAALADARVAPEQVSYVNAHATSTPLGDAIEVAALKQVFGARVRDIPINSTKSMVGHCLTASSTVELVACIEQMRHGKLHPTINQDEPDPELGLDFVPNLARDQKVDVAISNAFGFGGLNSCIVLGRV